MYIFSSLYLRTFFLMFYALFVVCYLFLYFFCSLLFFIVIYLEISLSSFIVYLFKNFVIFKKCTFKKFCLNDMFWLFHISLPYGNHCLHLLMCSDLSFSVYYYLVIIFSFPLKVQFPSMSNYQSYLMLNFLILMVLFHLVLQ